MRGEGADGEEEIAARENHELAVLRFAGCGNWEDEEGLGVGVGIDVGLGLGVGVRSIGWGVDALGWGVDALSSDAEELALGVAAPGSVIDVLGSSKRRIGAGIGSGTGAGSGSSTNAGARSTIGSAGGNAAASEAPKPLVDNCACELEVAGADVVSLLFLNKSSALSCFPFPFPFTVVPNALPNSGSAKIKLTDGTLLGSCCCVLELGGESTLVVGLDFEPPAFFGIGSPDAELELEI